MFGDACFYPGCSSERTNRAAEIQRQSMLAAVMTPEARERLARIAIVKPEKARSIEGFIIKGARTVRSFDGHVASRLCIK